MGWRQWGKWASDMSYHYQHSGAGREGDKAAVGLDVEFSGGGKIWEIENHFGSGIHDCLNIDEKLVLDEVNKVANWRSFDEVKGWFVFETPETTRPCFWIEFSCMEHTSDWWTLS